MLKTKVATIAIFVAVLAFAIPAFAGPSKEMIELQAQVQQLLSMQQSINEKMGVLQDNMKTLVQQMNENLNRVSATVDKLDKSMAQQKSASDSCVDQLAGSAQPLHDALTDLKASVAAINKQLTDMNAMRQAMPAPQQPPQQGATQGPGGVR